MSDDLQKIYLQIKQHFQEFENQHNINANGKKNAGVKARKEIGEVKKLITKYRKLSVDFNKKS